MRTTNVGVGALIRIDMGAFPLVHFRLSGVLDQPDAVAAVDAIQSGIRLSEQQERRFVIVADARAVERTTPMFRAPIGEFARRAEAADFDRLACRIVITQSRVVRGALTAMRWISVKLKGTRAVSTPAEAVDVLGEVVAEMQLDISEQAQNTLLRELHDATAA